MIEEIIKKYKPVGFKTLFMMIFKRSFIILVMLLAFGVAVFYIDYLPVKYFNLVVEISSVYVVVMIMLTVAVFFLGWLEYIRYGILLDAKDMKIDRGLFSTEHIGIPYRSIQDIRINRTLIDQILGISNVVISIASEESEGTAQDTIILSSLDRHIATNIQNVVLRRVQVEQIHVVKS